MNRENIISRRGSSRMTREEEQIAIKKAEEYIPATVHLIAGCQDHEKSKDVTYTKTGKSTGIFTDTLLKVLRNDTTKELTYKQVWQNTKDLMKKNFTQTPLLTSSRPLDVNQKFRIVPENNQIFTGTRRAVVIGINYTGSSMPLDGAQNDALDWVSYIKEEHGFQTENIKILMDDGDHTRPTRDNILQAYQTLVSQSRAGDAVFCFYAGHGSNTPDIDGDEEDGFDETIFPVDYEKEGEIVDDELFDVLIKPMQKGVTMTYIVDACHSGTILDLPFVILGDGKHKKLFYSEATWHNRLGGCWRKLSKVALRLRCARKIRLVSTALGWKNQPHKDQEATTARP